MKLLLILVLVVPGLCTSFRSSFRSHRPDRRLSNSRRFEFGTANNDFMREMMRTVSQSAQCQMCEMVVQDIQSILAGRETEIQNLLDSLCDDLPKEYASNCSSLVDTYLPLLFTFIDEMTPEEVCELLTMCTGEYPMPRSSDSMTVTLNKWLQKSLDRSQRTKDALIRYYRRQLDENYLCDACEETMGFVQEAVSCNYTWEFVAEFFEPLCQLFPQQRTRCVDFFNNLPGDVNSFALKYLDPETDCSILGFCEGEVVIEYIEEEEPEEDESEEVDDDDDADDDDNDDDELMGGMDTVAIRINLDTARRVYKTGSKRKPGYPMKMKPSTMNNYGRRAWEAVPRRLRRAIHVIIGGQEDVEQIPYSFSDAVGYYTVPDQKKCEVCLYFSAAAEGVLQYNQQDITNGIAEVIADICTAIPDPWKTTCNDEVQTMLPNVIVETLMTFFVPDHLCNDVIGICTGPQYLEE